MPKPNPFLRVAAIAQLTGLSRNQVRELIDTEQLPAYRTKGGNQGAGHRKVHISAVEAFLKRMGASPADPSSNEESEEVAA